MRRREFITLLGSAAISWSRGALAETSTKVYRLGSLDPARPLSANSPDATTLLTALAERGYTLGRNLAYDARASGGDNSKLRDVLEDFKASGVDVIVTIGYPATLTAKTAGIPTVAAAGVGDPVYESEPYVRAGGLMSYGGDRKELFQRAAALVDRIFKGARPGDLPFEQPTRYVFMINVGAAKAMGLEIPPNLMALADEVIE